MNKNKWTVYLPLIMAAVLLAGLLIGIQLGRNGAVFPFLGSSKDNKLNGVIRYVEDNYVDTVSRQVLTDKAISGMLQGLDPHSVYILPSEFHDYTDPLIGSFEGIGVRFQLERDTITVINTISGGPSEKIGIRAGDRIVRIDGKNVAGIRITNADVLKMLKGKKGSRVNVSIFRRGVGSLLDFTITRDVIPTYSVDIAYMATPAIGYIRLNNFSETTAGEVEKALLDLKSGGMTKLIIDLRGNGGGYLKAAILVADQLLPEGKLIVYTEGAHHRKDVFYAESGGLFEKGDVVILIDEWSASASEILAGAIQDNDRGTILGRRSFGKGLVQEQMNMKDGSAIRLTVARYYTPTGRCIQKPYTGGTDAYYLEYYHRVQNGDNEVPDTSKIPDSLKFKTPKGKIVYGGGGILPDILVPAEKDSALLYYSRAVNKGVIYQFAFDYTDRYRKELSRFRTPDEFGKNFRVTDDIYAGFIDAAGKQGIKREGKDLALSDARIRTLIKAYIGRNILDNPGFYPFLNTIDPDFLKALEILNRK
jgi:carboxyl-terminal processing protease